MKHRSLQAELAEAIHAGRFPPGSRLPAERTLTTTYAVSRITVRSALAALVNDGLIERRHGSGTYVCDRPAKPSLVVVHRRVVANASTDWFMTEMLEHLSKILAEDGRHLTWVAVHQAGSMRDQLARVGICVRPGLPVLLSGYEADVEELRFLKNAGAQVVTISHPMNAEPVVSLGADHAAAARRATRHLLEHGRHRVLLANGPYSLETCKERLVGWRQAHDDLNLPCDESLSIPTIMWDIESGRRLGREYVAGRHRCDAILAYGDWFTQGFLTVLHSAHVRIPTDIACIAGDGYAWMRAAAPYPDLSYLSESRFKLARTALTTLDDLARGKTCPDRLLVPVDFIAGTSCGCSP